MNNNKTGKRKVQVSHRGIQKRKINLCTMSGANGNDNIRRDETAQRKRQKVKMTNLPFVERAVEPLPMISK